jgi:hypothetical protein
MRKNAGSGSALNQCGSTTLLRRHVHKTIPGVSKIEVQMFICITLSQLSLSLLAINIFLPERAHGFSYVVR